MLGNIIYEKSVNKLYNGVKCVKKIYIFSVWFYFGSKDNFRE